MGEPVDPQLAAVYQHLGAAEFGTLALYGPSTEEGGLIPKNQWLRKRGQVQYCSTLVFGWEPGFAFYYGTVPKLARSQGLQPVVFISAMEALFAVPIASSVDRFFHLYSHYLERRVADDSVGGGLSYVTFPWDMVDLVVQDEPLIEQVRATRFDFLTDNDKDALEWLEELRASQS